MKKYEKTYLPEEGLYRIRAIVDHAVKAGDLDGMIEGEHNLSHDGDCWVHC